MREVSEKDLIENMAAAQVAFSPVTDNITLPSGRAERWRSGKNAKVPLLMGTIAQEGRALVNRDVNMSAFTQTYLPEPLVSEKQRRRIFEEYERDPSLESDFDVAAAIYTDFLWQCVSASRQPLYHGGRGEEILTAQQPQSILANISSSILNPTWRFLFNVSVTTLLPPKYAWLGKFHGSDVVLLFSTPTLDQDGLTPQLYTFARYLRGVVGGFVRNPSQGPGWPAVGSRYRPFDVASLEGTGPVIMSGREMDRRCELYDEIYPLVERFDSSD